MEQIWMVVEEMRYDTGDVHTIVATSPHRELCTNLAEYLAETAERRPFREDARYWVAKAPFMKTSIDYEELRLDFEEGLKNG